MTALTCLRMNRLVDRRASGLSPAEALRLEEHLSQCERCHARAKLFDGLGRIIAEQQTALSPQARERAIASAFEQARVTEPARSSVGAWQLGLAVALGATLGLTFVLRDGKLPAAKPGSSSPNATATNSERTDRVFAGEIEIEDRPAAVGASIVDGAKLRATRDATLVLAHATIELRAGTLLHWNASERSVALEAGSVIAEVDPAAHRDFTVRTPSFSVLVLGTRFEVSLDAVQVTRGRVRVTSLAGQELATLGAGETFSTHASAAEPARDTVQPNAIPKTSSHVQRVGHAPLTNSADLLAEARADLAQKQVSRAEHAIDAALAHPLEPSERAEALSLRAECALVAGKLGAAVEAYLRVAREFPTLPAAETAAFAAARLQAELGQKSAAMQALTHYLQRYPHGRFTKEAQARLNELKSAPTR